MLLTLLFRFFPIYFYLMLIFFLQVVWIKGHGHKKIVVLRNDMKGEGASLYLLFEVFLYGLYYLLAQHAMEVSLHQCLTSKACVKKKKPQEQMYTFVRAKIT